MSVSTIVSSQRSLTLFNLETGIITPEFKKQLEIVGVKSRQFFSEYDSDHIFNVKETLERSGCFQKDADFYKSGGTSAFQINYEQAVAFLNDDYSGREVIMPRGKKLANAIFPCGVEATIHKRFNSLHESLVQGFKYDTIHFIVQDAKTQKKTEELISERYRELLEGINVNFVIADAELNIFEAGLSKLAASSAVSEEYVIITDPTFSSKVEMISSTILKDKKCLGIASAPVKDWNIDMHLYGYEIALGSHEKATIAWASSAWNFKARQANTELQKYKTIHQIV